MSISASTSDPQNSQAIQDSRWHVQVLLDPYRPKDFSQLGYGWVKECMLTPGVRFGHGLDGNGARLDIDLTKVAENNGIVKADIIWQNAHYEPIFIDLSKDVKFRQYQLFKIANGQSKTHLNDAEKQNKITSMCCEIYNDRYRKLQEAADNIVSALPNHYQQRKAAPVTSSGQARTDQILASLFDTQTMTAKEAADYPTITVTLDEDLTKKAFNVEESEEKECNVHKAEKKFKVHTLALQGSPYFLELMERLNADEIDTVKLPFSEKLFKRFLEFAYTRKISSIDFSDTEQNDREFIELHNLMSGYGFSEGLLTREARNLLIDIEQRATFAKLRQSKESVPTPEKFAKILEAEPDPLNQSYKTFEAFMASIQNVHNSSLRILQKQLPNSASSEGFEEFRL